MEPKPELNQPPQQPFPAINQPRNSGPPISHNLSGPRPQNPYPGENQARQPPPPIQRLDSRSVISQPQQPLQSNQQYHQPPIVQQQRPPPPLQQQQSQQQVPYQQSQVPRPLGAPTPQYQQPRLDNLNKVPQINRGPPNQQPQQQLPPQQNRPPPPLQQPSQPINLQQLPPQRLPFNRPPGAPLGPPLNQQPQILQKVPPQAQFQGLQHGQGQGLVQSQPGQGPPHATHSPADGPQNIRLTSGQFRPQNPYQPTPIVNQPNPNLIGAPKLPSFIEERRKMSTDINQDKPANYLISNTDDVDDVIVRPISQTSISSLPRNDSKPPSSAASNGQTLIQGIPKPKSATPEELNRNSNSPSGFKVAPKPESAVSFNEKPRVEPRAEPATVRSPVPQAQQPSKIVPPSIIRKPSNDDVITKNNSNVAKPNGSAGKATEKIAIEPGRSASQSRASSHKSQEDVMQRSTSRNRMLKLLEKPAEPPKKVSMNKIKVGNAPPPNLRQVRSKIGSLDNAAHKPGGGRIKIETKKLEFNAQPRIAAKNDTYSPGGGDKKITNNKLQWNAKPKVGSLDNASHKPGGGDKKILTVKTEFRENAKPKVGSKDYSSEAGKAPTDIENP